MTTSLLKHDNLAVRLGQATGSSHVSIVITGRRGGLVGWWHSLFRGLSWEREWACVIA